MRLSLIVLWILNLFDALATCYAVKAGYAEEMNPAMSFLINKGWAWFFGVKIGFITFSVIWFGIMYAKDQSVRRTIQVAIGTSLVMYSLVDIWHAIVYFWAN